MIQFYSPEIEVNGCLSEEESAHCCRVLRNREGDEIIVTDGKGNRFKCVVTKADVKKTEVEIIEKITLYTERNYRLTLAVAPTKNADRMEWMVEKGVEIGVDEIILLKCGRSERKVQKTDRLRKVMISAMKQSLGTIMPDLIELTDYSEFINSQSKESQKFFGYCSEDYPRKEFVNEIKPGSDVVVMIGPEGDFTVKEVKEAVEKGFIPVSFGNKRLRTETAGVFAVSAVNTINQLNAD